MIILDLEWNRGYDKKPLDEILQIGAVRVERPGGPVLDTFCIFIRPVVHRRFDPGAKKLPELQASMASNVDFPTALERFRVWCGGETVFAAWGGGDDFRTLEKNCAYWGVPPVAVERVCNFQRAFSYLTGAGQQIALWRAVEYCGIPDVFDFHTALYDALYTAVIGEWITPEALAQEPSGRRSRGAAPRLSRLPFPGQPCRKVGPRRSREEILNDEVSRRPVCPLCKRVGSVSRWCYVEAKGEETARTYYSVFRCAEHGRFVCLLTLEPAQDGGWVGRRTVPALTPELIRAYEAARQGDAFDCRRNGKKRKRRKRRRRPA